MKLLGGHHESHPALLRLFGTHVLNFKFGKGAWRKGILYSLCSLTRWKGRYSSLGRVGEISLPIDIQPICNWCQLTTGIINHESHPWSPQQAT